MGKLSIERRRAGDVTVLGLQGDITAGEGGRDLGGTLMDLVTSGERKILLDLGRTRFVDSSGLGHLIAGRNMVRGEGGELKLVRLPARVRDLFVITKLVTVFEIFDEESAALASYNSTAGSDRMLASFGRAH